MNTFSNATAEAGHRLSELGASSGDGFDNAMLAVMLLAILLLMIAPLACSKSR